LCLGQRTNTYNLFSSIFISISPSTHLSF
jgi:hypothetical protein